MSIHTCIQCGMKIIGSPKLQNCPRCGQSIGSDPSDVLPKASEPVPPQPARGYSRTASALFAVLATSMMFLSAYFVQFQITKEDWTGTVALVLLLLALASTALVCLKGWVFYSRFVLPLFCLAVLVLSPLLPIWVIPTFSDTPEPWHLDPDTARALVPVMCVAPVFGIAASVLLGLRLGRWIGRFTKASRQSICGPLAAAIFCTILVTSYLIAAAVCFMAGVVELNLKIAI